MVIRYLEMILQVDILSIQYFRGPKNFPVCRKLNFRVSVHQSAVQNCVVNIN